MSPNVLVILEVRERRFIGASLQCVVAAKALASAWGGAVHALAIGEGLEWAPGALAGMGVTALTLVDSPDFGAYRARAFTTAACAAIDHVSPRATLMATSFLSRDLAPRVAVRCGATLATDCTRAEATGSGAGLRVARTLYSGKCVGEFATDPERPAIVTIRPNSFASPPAASGAAPTVERLTPALTDADRLVRAVEVVKTAGTAKDVTEADIVVGGGRSLKSAENFRILEDLAATLDAAVGASRAACDAGYQPHARQIGLTGKVITPRLYFAFGIDGAIQHLAGIRGSKVIVAINTKKEAPIFEAATYGCIADLFEFAPALTAELRRLREGA